MVGVVLDDQLSFSGDVISLAQPFRFLSEDLIFFLFEEFIFCKSILASIPAVAIGSFLTNQSRRQLVFNLVVYKDKDKH